MIAYIKGKLAQAWNKSCIVLTEGGVGYRLALPGHTFSALPEQGADVSFYTSMVVREDALELYGFSTFEERQTFELLRAINKIGARTALAILSAYRPAELEKIIMEENIAALTKVPGLGQKTAQHVFLEMRYKLAAINKASAPAPFQAAGVYGDVIAALANLGYKEDECGQITREILKNEPDLDTGGAIRLALKELAARRG